MQKLIFHCNANFSKKKKKKKKKLSPNILCFDKTHVTIGISVFMHCH